MKIKCRVVEIIFGREDFVIFSAKNLENNRIFGAKGVIPDIYEKGEYILNGTWENSKRY